MKGLHWRMGSIAPSRVTREDLRRLDGGTLYITSKRILLTGAHKGYHLRYSSVLGIEVFSDAIRVEKASGRSPVLVLPDPEVPAAILGAAELTGITAAACRPPSISTTDALSS
jgi:hypothetical protein